MIRLKPPQWTVFGCDSRFRILVAGRRVTVVMDCDPAGRKAARRIASDLKAGGVSGSILDRSSGREDGYDFTRLARRVRPRWALGRGAAPRASPSTGGRGDVEARCVT